MLGRLLQKRIHRKGRKGRKGKPGTKKRAEVKVRGAAKVSIDTRC
jgi:hypothetical protein